MNGTVNAVKLSWSAVAALVIASVVTLAAFGWPFVAATSGVGEGSSHSTDAPWIFVLVLPLLAMIVLAEVNAGGIDAKAIALLGMLASIGGALRALSPGAAGLEPSFAVIMLGGRVFGRGFGFVQGALTLFVGALLTGGVGPWLPFQMIAAGWVGFLSGALPKRLTGRSEVVALALLGFVLGVAYGALMNLWFWPFGGYGAGLSFDAAVGPAANAESYFRYYLATSVLWDVSRGVCTFLLLLLIGRPLLRALKRVSRLAAFEVPVTFRPGRSATCSTKGSRNEDAGDRWRPVGQVRRRGVGAWRTPPTSRTSRRATPPTTTPNGRPGWRAIWPTGRLRGPPSRPSTWPGCSPSTAGRCWSTA